MSSVIYSYGGLNNPNYAIQIGNGRYIISDRGNSRIIELNSTLTTITKNYSIAGVVFFDYSEINETLLITNELTNIISEITWSDIDWGNSTWQSSYSFNGPQCATYKQYDINKIAIADYGNNSVVKYSRLTDEYEVSDHYKLNIDDVSVIHEISSFYKPYRVYQYSDESICIFEKEGRPLSFETIESSSSSSSSSFDCPNNISLLTTTIYDDVNELTTDDFLSININNTMGSGNNYIQMYSGDTTGKDYDSNRVFYGHFGDSGVLTTSGFVKVVINGSDYYIQVYSGDMQLDCCSNIAGDFDSVEAYQTAGYIMVDCNSTLKFIIIWERI